MNEAVWTTKYINALPDSAFLYVGPDGRYFPVKDASGNIDLPHLRNALARIPQSKVPQAAKDAALAKAQSLAKANGVETAADAENPAEDKGETNEADTLTDQLIAGLAAHPDRIREGQIVARDVSETTEDSKGRKWGVVIIQEGMSKNRNRYSRETLAKATALYESAPVYIDHAEEARRYGRSVKDKAGFLKDVRGAVIGDGREAAGGTYAVVGTLVITKAWVRREMVEAWEEGNPNHFGLSHDATCESTTAISAEDGQPFYDVLRVERVDSVDLVGNPAAGGRVLRLVASADPAPTLEGDGRMLTKLIEAIRKSGNAELIARLDALGATPTEDAVLGLYNEALKPVEPTKKVEAKEVTPDPEPKPKAGDPPMARITEAQWLDSQRHARTYFLESTVNGTSLPVPVQEDVVEQYRAAMKEAKSADDLPTENQIRDHVARQVKLFGKLVEAKVVLPGGNGGTPRAEVTKDRRDKMIEAFDAFFDKKKAATSFRQLYVQFTGDERVSGKISEATRLTEALQTSSFDQILGDSITRAMVREYAASNQAQWRGTIAEVVPVTDFRTQRRMRFGGYGNLTTVAEGAPYPSLVSPTDEEATYAPAKRGGTEQVTLEMIANDDVGALRRIPTRLSRAASQTIYEFVFDFLATNANIYDSAALIAAGHNNNSTTALASSVISALRLKMRNQTDMSNGKRLGLNPKYIIGPNDLQELMWQLTNAQKMLPDSSLASTADPAAPNFIQNIGLTPIVVDYWTDVNNWFLTASVTDVPMIEIGFYGGENPDLFVQDMPNVGSMFSNDVITYKMRHIYGGGVLDYRGFAGSIVAG